MPDIITHILFGEDMIDEVSKWEESQWKENIFREKELFILGCQGPDIFFYNDFLPWKKNKRGPKVGRQMHLEKTGDFFLEGLKYIKKEKGELRDIASLFTYLSGFMCHFALDKKAHPFIFYFTGEYDKARPETVQYRGYHKRLELIIDTILLKEKRNMKSYRYKIGNKIDLGDSLPKSVNGFYDYIFKELYNLKVDKGLANSSYKDIKSVFRIIYDPFGLKKSMLYALDFFANDKRKYSNLTYPRELDESVDYMNKSHNMWLHPCDKGETYNDSFYDLYESALEDGKDMIRASIEYINNERSFDDIRRLFLNVTYSTGKEKNKCHIQKYFSPIFH